MSDIDIIINGNVIPQNTILTNITITKEEGQNTLAMFSLRSPNNIIDYATYLDGASVIINFYRNNQAYRVFTGKIDSPQIDLKFGIIKLSCSQRREELIRSKYPQFSYALGRYSSAVQGDAIDIVEETEMRMRTIPASLDFDSYNTPNVTSWYAKNTPDFTFGNGGVRYTDINVEWQSRTDIINTYNITVKYAFSRLYHWQRGFNWTPPFYNNLADYMAWDYDLPSVKIIKDATDTNVWKRIGSITFASLWDEQDVIVTNPYPNTTGGHYQYKAHWKPNVQQGRTEYVFDETGNRVKDINGNDTYVFVPFTSQQQLENTVCRASSWTMATRFAQNVEETYNLTLTSPQSISKYGSVVREKTVVVQADFDTSSWEQFASITGAPDGSVVQGSSFYYNQKYNVSSFNNALLAALEMARAEIVDSHRGTIVSIKTDLKPEIEIRHTIQVNTEVMSCKGKTQRVIHTIDPGSGDFTTQIDIAIMRSQGSASNTPFTVPAPPSDGLVIPGGVIYLGSHYGLDPDTTPGADAWNGHIGNKTIYGAVAFFLNLLKVGRTQFTQQFRVDTPAITDAMRERRTLATSASYTLALVNDTFTSP